MCGELDRIAATDVAVLDGGSLRDELVDLVALANRCYAETLRRVDAFDARGLSKDDGFRTATSWLVGALRIAPARANRLVKAARLLRQLPKLSAAVQAGLVPSEHVDVVARLADRVGVERLVEGDGRWPMPRRCWTWAGSGRCAGGSRRIWTRMVPIRRRCLIGVA